MFVKSHLHEGDLLSFETLKSGDILVKPVHVVKKTQAYYWTDKWQKGIGESEKAMEQKEFEVFDNVSQAKRSLKHGKKNSHT